MPDDIVNPATPPVLALLQTGGPAAIQAEDGNWLLDLGEVAAGSLLPTLHFGVQNTALPPADALTVRLEVAADPEYRVFAPAAFEDIPPLSGEGEVAVIFETASPGEHVATVILHPEQVAADGSVTPLPDRVLTIHETVVGSLDAATIPAEAFTASLPANRLLTSPIALDGQDFARIANLGAWSGSGTLDIAVDRAAARQFGDAYLLATFETVHADFSAAGHGRTIDVVGVASGSLALARGDTALWSFISGGAPDGATITTQGHAEVTVTALGANTLDDRIAANSLLPYGIYPFSLPRGGSTYDGHLSTAHVELGGRGNTVTAEAAVNLVVQGGAGHNHVVGGGGVNVFDLDGRHDWLEAGSGQDTFIERQGSVGGDRITGFQAGDVIRFEGFAADATLSDLGGGRWRVADGAGHHESLWVEGVDQLVLGTDYLFA